MAQTSIVIEAPPDRVWDVLSDFDSYKDWNKWIYNLRSHDASVKIGTQVTFQNKLTAEANPGTYTVRIITWDPKREFAWQGGPFGPSLQWLLRGQHYFRVVSEGDDRSRTRFEHGERLEGPLKFLMTANVLSDLEKMLNSFNADLKRRLEQGTPAEQPRF